MTPAVIFGILAVFLFVLLLYFTSLLVFYLRETKHFRASCKEESYLEYLYEKEKKVKSGRKRNFLLFLRCKSYEHRGEMEKAEKLLPFIKKDSLFEIK